MSVYILFHQREVNLQESIKLIGVYSTRENAEAARERARARAGFRDAPDGFTIDEYPLDEDHWTEGYGLGEE
jgi:hypothetical protein